MFKALFTASALALFATLPAIAAAPVTVTQKTVNGLAVDQYKWIDSKGRPRTVSLKREGAGNPGHGGYAIQMTYQYLVGNVWQTMIVNAARGGDGGFGYFVSHERYRHFADGRDNTIAGKIFRRDDSPLGLAFPVVASKPVSPDPAVAMHRFKLNYPRYGTLAASPLVDGNDVGLSLSPAAYKLYSLPVTITWVFQTGTDYPRIRNDVDMTPVGSGEHVSYDVRGPYGVMEFAGANSPVVQRVVWGDRFHFAPTTAPLTLNTPWTWNRPNTGARYHALISNNFEMGLFEPKLWTKSSLADGYSDARASTSAIRGPQDCGTRTATNQVVKQLLPCGWEWPYQSMQYSLDPLNPNLPGSGKKMAWGSSPYYGTGPSVTQAFDTANTFQNINGFPASKHIAYDVCIVLGRTTANTLTRTAAATPDKNCARAPF